MNFSGDQILLPIFFLMGITLIISTDALLCPSASSFAPCYCRADMSQIFCYGSDAPISLQDVSRVINLLREVNGVSADEWLSIGQFWITHTDLPHLDLTPFIFLRMEALLVRENHNMTSILGPPLTDHEGLIGVNVLELESNALTDEGLSNSLKYFEPDRLQSLLIRNNFLTGQSGEGIEFLPGLGAFHNLKYVALDQNQIRSLDGRQFQNHSRLYYLTLSENGLDQIDDNAFLFNQPISPVDYHLVLNLDNNFLTTKSISARHGLDQLRREVQFLLRKNFLDTLPAQIFEGVLKAWPKNVVEVGDNQIFCDAGTHWLRNGRDEFKKFVWNADCINDIGLTVFTSNVG